MVPTLEKIRKYTRWCEVHQYWKPDGQENAQSDLVRSYQQFDINDIDDASEDKLAHVSVSSHFTVCGFRGKFKFLHRYDNQNERLHEGKENPAKKRHKVEMHID